MEEIKNSIFFKLNRLIDRELEKESPDTELVGECVDGILRLMPEKAYQLTDEQRKSNINRILNEKSKHRSHSKIAKILLAAAIIAALLMSVLAYTIVEYKIHDYDTYSTVWANMVTGKINSPVTASYIPSGYELIDSDNRKYLSSKTYYNGEFYLTVNKDSTGSSDINTEYGAAHTVTADGIRYIFFGEDVHGRGVIWYDHGCCYSIISFLSEEELLKIAESVS